MYFIQLYLCKLIIRISLFGKRRFFMHRIDINTFFDETNVIESSVDKLKKINGGCDGLCVIQVGRCLDGGYYFRKIVNPCGRVSQHRNDALKRAKAENGGNGLKKGTYKPYYY